MIDLSARVAVVLAVVVADGAAAHRDVSSDAVIDSSDESECPAVHGIFN